MKRRLRVGIRSRDASYTAALQALQQVESGNRKAQTPGLYFESLEDLRRAFTPKRMDLLVAILRQAPGSVTELALTLLRQIGLVEFVTATGHGNARTPVVPYDEIDITIDLQSLAQQEAA